MGKSFLSAFTSHKTDEWRTPSVFYKLVMRKGYFDPCRIGAKEDGLGMIWAGAIPLYARRIDRGGISYVRLIDRKVIEDEESAGLAEWDNPWEAYL